MAGPYKAMILLNTADAGWSETHWIPGASLTTAQANAQTICTARLALALSTVKCFGIRVVDVTTPRLGYIFSSTTPQGTYNPTGTWTTVEPNLAVLVRLNAADGLTKARHYLRGVPNNQMPALTALGWDPLAWGYTSDFTTNLTAYINALIANAQLRSRIGGGAPVYKAISAGSYGSQAVLRKAGRPFAQRRGRRLLV